MTRKTKSPWVCASGSDSIRARIAKLEAGGESRRRSVTGAMVLRARTGGLSRTTRKARFLRAFSSKLSEIPRCRCLESIGTDFLGFLFGTSSRQCALGRLPIVTVLPLVSFPAGRTGPTGCRCTSASAKSCHDAVSMQAVALSGPPPACATRGVGSDARHHATGNQRPYGASQSDHAHPACRRQPSAGGVAGAHPA